MFIVTDYKMKFDIKNVNGAKLLVRTTVTLLLLCHYAVCCYCCWIEIRQYDGDQYADMQNTLHTSKIDCVIGIEKNY